MNRIKRTAPVIRSRAEMEILVGDICTLKIEEQKIKTGMDEEIKAIRDQYDPDLAGIADELNLKMMVAQAWSEANLGEFGKLKSVDMTHGIVGWRTGQPQPKTISGWTWDRVLEKLEGLPLMAAYIRTKREVNKQALVADREKFGEADLRAVGVRIIQDEAFFVEPKIQTVEPRVTTEAA